MGFLSFFGLDDKITKAINRGAIVIDVRPAHAFDQNGRVPGSLNIPLDRIPINLERLKDIKRPIIICCAFGQDCDKAAAILRQNGITNVYNGGNWQSVFKKVK
jgi:rhodanese-related sulfurtransferase